MTVLGKELRKLKGLVSHIDKKINSKVTPITDCVNDYIEKIELLYGDAIKIAEKELEQREKNSKK